MDLADPQGLADRLDPSRPLHLVYPAYPVHQEDPLRPAYQGFPECLEHPSLLPGQLDLQDRWLR